MGVIGYEINSFIIVVLLTFINSQNVTAVVVTVKEGRLRGEKVTTVTGKTEYYSFKGIPYAAPPVGDLRFQAPKPVASWNGIKNANKHGSTCVQLSTIPNETVSGSEDCLYLNVYTPNIRPTRQLSVMLFIHGGIFISGSGDDDLYGPDFFIDQNVIVVTFNYRLDALGFLSLDTKELPGNAGLKDQVAAMKWVRRNIARFGGDRDMVTLTGHSAGGVSCTLHLLSPMSKGLFRRVIPLSGTFTLDSSIQYEPKRRAVALGKILGYETENMTALFEFLKSVPYYRLFNAKSEVIIADMYLSPVGGHTYYFAPAVEKNVDNDRFLVESPMTSVENERVHNVDMLLGFESTEGLIGISGYESYLISNFNRYPELLAPVMMSYNRSPKTNLKISDVIKRHYFGTRPISTDTMAEMVKYFSDTFEYQILRYTRDVSIINKKKIYLYRSTGVTERNVYGIDGARYGISGSTHMDILMYLFQANRFDIPLNVNSISYKMIEQRTKLIANFVKYGNPTPDASLGVIWQQYNQTTQSYLDMGKKLVPLVRPAAATMQFWENIYEMASLPFYLV